MTKMYFAKSVKYLGTKYPPNAELEVQDKDVEDLKAAGGWVRNEPEEKKEDPKSELEDLREKAEKLEIDVKGNWGVKKLTSAIEEVEAE